MNTHYAIMDVVEVVLSWDLTDEGFERAVNYQTRCMMAGFGAD